MALKSVVSTTKAEMKRLIESLCGFGVAVVRTVNTEVKKRKNLTSHCLHGRQVISRERVLGRTLCNERFVFKGFRRIHSGRRLSIADRDVGPTNGSESSAIVEGGGGDGKPGVTKRNKLKGKRAVVRWLKLLRWKKKKEYHRMTSEEKILYKLRLARKKEERLVEALKKIEPKEASETAHDPEILTPEEHFFFLKMGLKSKNYVPIGRRGIYGGVILNMHLHWKKHQTLQVVVKTFTPEEVKEVAKELARLSGGIVLDIHEENTIIMYRGKNYSQPPTEIMSPRETLSRKRALDKSKYRDGLRAVRKHLPKLEQELQLLQARAKNEPASVSDLAVEEETQETDLESVDSESYSDELKEKTYKRDQCSENDDDDDDGNRVRIGLDSVSEDLSDIFDTDSEIGSEESLQRPLYMEEFDKFLVKSEGGIEDFDDHLRRISVDTKSDVSPRKDARLQNFDEVDRLFLRAATLLKKKSR